MSAFFIGLTTTQVAALTTTQIVALSTTDIQSLNVTQTPALTTTSVVTLTTTILPAMPPPDVTVLTTTQLVAFNTTQSGVLTTSQIAALAALPLDYSPSYIAPPGTQFPLIPVLSVTPNPSFPLAVVSGETWTSNVTPFVLGYSGVALGVTSTQIVTIKINEYVDALGLVLISTASTTTTANVAATCSLINDSTGAGGFYQISISNAAGVTAILSNFGLVNTAKI